MTEIGESVGVPVVGAAEEQEEREATITARWSKRWVTPDHNSNWPPKSPPTDDVPEEAKVRMLVVTSEVPDGTGARIMVHHCHTKALVKDGTLDGLEVRGNRVIDPATGVAPEFVFEAKHDLWDPWDKPFYYFKVTVDHEGLQAETTRDFDKERHKVLRLNYWHACVSDRLADRYDGLTTRSEMQEIAGIIGKGPQHSVYRRDFNQPNVPRALWGSVLRNTYAYHHASHGTIRDQSGLDYTGPANPPDVSADQWRSMVAFGSMAVGITVFGAGDVSQVGDIPSVPRYLVYMNTCVAGWEKSLGEAFTSRGTQNYIAFRMYIPDREAREMARRFYTKWAGTYKCDPARIPQVFWDVGAAFYDTMRPVLIGQGGGAIHRFQVWNVLEEAFEGLKASVSSFFR